MKEIVIGATGFIGSALLRNLGPTARGTARRQLDGCSALDLLRFVPNDIPVAEILYLCAGANGAKACEGSQDAFRMNVDAPIQIARIAAARGHFMVFISSMSVEWLSTGYQRQKLAAEGVLRTMDNVGVVRAGRVLAGNVDELCAVMMSVGRTRTAGVIRWGNDDIAYDPRAASAPR
mgnify:CR=1 FL=1